MAMRWKMLLLLFAVRTTMAFQFQAVAALSQVFEVAFGVGLADIGVLIGLYLAPGIVFALPGGAAGRRLGDRNVVAGALALMAAGGLIMALAPGWGGQLAGRLLAGVGGVGLNVMMTKMVTDWFAGREIATAMAVFVNSWPFGIALALMVLPLLTAGGGLTVAMLVVAALCVAGLVLLLAGYRDPPATAGASASRGAWPRGTALRLTLLAGAIWALFNCALAVVFSFGPALLTEQGYPLVAAGSRVSLVLWGVAVSTALGGWLADRWNRDAVLGAGLLGAAAMLVVLVQRPDSVVLLFGFGLVAGLAPGPIMSLPAQALAPAVRSAGMGLYFTLYYVGIVAGPLTAGILAEELGSAAVALWLGTACLVAAAGLLAVFRKAARPPAV